MKLFESVLQSETVYNRPMKSFSPCFSYFNIVTDERTAGIGSVCMDYNRRTARLWSPFIKIGQETCQQYTARPDSVSLTTAEGSRMKVAYYERNAFLVSVVTNSQLVCFETAGGELGDVWGTCTARNEYVLHGYAYNRDPRDPDPQVGLVAGIRVLNGKLSVEGERVIITPDTENKIVAAVVFGAGLYADKELSAAMKRAPRTVGQAVESTRKWMRECLGNMGEADISNVSEVDRRLISGAVLALTFNLCEMPGNLSGYISALPQRGNYTTHFTWDSCFQNLAYEKMNPRIARDSLLQLVKNMRPDGKIPQFLCCTWARPHEVQPPLISWAAKRLYSLTRDRAFLSEVFKALEINNRWWLTQRMTRYGLLYCPHGLETGQDDSPRFDQGAVLATDMNAYFLSQLRICAGFAEELGYPSKARNWRTQADTLATNIIRTLYDPDSNLFYDVSVSTGEMIKTVTPCGLLPLWAGVPLPEHVARDMIGKWLLNPDTLYGEYPFPSVAYNDPSYQPRKWWRGPLWLPEAWLMLELLQMYGMQSEYDSALGRLYSMIQKSGQMFEFWDSQTGEGLGSPEQGWTAAVYIRLFTELRGMN